MQHRVLILGVGRLGIRYLEGMTHLNEPLDIWVCDRLKSNLDLAKEAWLRIVGSSSGHQLFYSLAIEDLPDFFDLVVIATTADVRPDVVRMLAQQSEVRFWILEKVLAQSVIQLAQIREALEGKGEVWVNTPRHSWSLYKNLRARVGRSKSLHAQFKGFDGLACNAMHYIDLVSRWSDARVSDVDTTGLDKKWIASKRPGFFEIQGCLFVTFTDSSTLKLISNGVDREYKAWLTIGDSDWDVYEQSDYAVNAANERVTGRCELQSELTAILFREIFEGGYSSLPTLQQSILQHQPYIEAMLAHWNTNMQDNRILIPIT